MAEHLNPVIILSKIISISGVIGFALVFGSIASLIAMNVVTEKQPSIQAVYWQRLFVSKISSACIIPGALLLNVSCLLSSFLQPDTIRNNFLIAAVLTGLILFNIFFFLTPLVKKVTLLAVEQMNTSTDIPKYASLKKTEDRLGAVNVVLLILSLIILCSMPFNKESNTKPVTDNMLKKKAALYTNMQLEFCSPTLHYQWFKREFHLYKL